MFNNLGLLWLSVSWSISTLIDAATAKLFVDKIPCLNINYRYSNSTSLNARYVLCQL